MKQLIPTIKMMNEMLLVIASMEMNGIAIDLEVLNELDYKYSKAVTELEKDLRERAWRAMGDTPINLNSPEQVSQLLYSRRVKSKKDWIEIFNIGTEVRGSTRKPKRQNRYKKTEFNRIVRDNTDRLYKTKAEECKACLGVGKVARKRKDGTYGAARYRCQECNALGRIFRKLKQYAGFKLAPLPTDEATNYGFSTSKSTIKGLLTRARSDEAKLFLSRLANLNTFNTYKETYIGGIRRGLCETLGSRRILHPQYMQTVTATGRLSSRNPNFHNQPRGTKCPQCIGEGCEQCLDTGYVFPIRKCIVSRWRHGKIGKADYSGLEFRVAAQLSGCRVAIEDILNNIDPHMRTSEIMKEHGQEETRQDAKPHTFKPLYGGTSGTDAERAYYQWFLEYHTGISSWQKELISEVLRTGRLVLPTGRTYDFENVVRYSNGSVSNATQIKNYPVQGLATADMVPVATIEVHKRFREAGFKSCLINEVHDEIVWDCYPGEEKATVEAVYGGMMAVPELLIERYNYELIVPIDVEVSMGDNYLEMEDVTPK